MAACLCAGSLAALQSPAATSGEVVLDRVVAVVNRQVILASDVELERRMAEISAGSVPVELTPPRALDQLISRALIEQQIRQDAAGAGVPVQAAASDLELRRQLPGCAQDQCATDAGWAAFLAAHRLTAARVDAWLRARQKVLAFIEVRFRQGIRVSDAEVEAYYRGTLLPRLPAGQTPPALASVAARIQQILLEQQVNALFDDWLKNLRQQGDVEVLDPALEAQQPNGGSGEASP